MRKLVQFQARTVFVVTWVALTGGFCMVQRGGADRAWEFAADKYDYDKDGRVSSGSNRAR